MTTRNNGTYQENVEATRFNLPLPCVPNVSLLLAALMQPAAFNHLSDFEFRRVHQQKNHLQFSIYSFSFQNGKIQILDHSTPLAIFPKAGRFPFLSFRTPAKFRQNYQTPDSTCKIQMVNNTAARLPGHNYVDMLSATC